MASTISSSSSSTATTIAQKALNPLLIRRLYRSILKTSKPFIITEESTTTNYNNNIQLPPTTTTATNNATHNVTTPTTSSSSSISSSISSSLRTPIVMNCLLHRTGYNDESWMDFLRGFTTTIRTTTSTTNDNHNNNHHHHQQQNNNIRMELLSRDEREQTLLRILLREVLCGGNNGGTLPQQQQQPTSSSSSSSSLGLKIMQYPIHVRHHTNPKNRILHIIQREFRIPIQEHIFDGITRQNIIFQCIRELNKKIVYAYNCEQKYIQYYNNNNSTGTTGTTASTTKIPKETMNTVVSSTTTTDTTTATNTTTTSTTSLHDPNHNHHTTYNNNSNNNPFYYQMAKDVYPLPYIPSSSSSSSYLRPGIFLLAHPYMTGYFRRSVICILDHRTFSHNNDDDDEEENDTTNTATMTTSDDTYDDDDDDDDGNEDMEDLEDDDSDDDDGDDDDDEDDDDDVDTDDEAREDENIDAVVSVKVKENDDNDDNEISISIAASTNENSMGGKDEMETATTVHMEEHMNIQQDDQPLTSNESKQEKRRKSKSSRKKQSKQRKSQQQQQQQQYGTYGLIVNRLTVSPYTGEALCMNDVLRPLPSSIMKTFGKYPIREGGPVHMSVQMLYQINTSIANRITTTSTTGDDESDENSIINHHNIGGYILPTIQPDIALTTTTETNDISSSNTAHAAIGSCDTDKAVYYRGNIMNVKKAMESGIIENGEDDISFFVGASCWSVGQLEREIENGFWLPCIGPTSIAQTGMCDYYNYDNNNNNNTKKKKTTASSSSSSSSTTTNIQNDTKHDHPRPEADLWLSMMSACGIEEAKLAHLLYKNDEKDPNGLACDAANSTTTSK